MITTAFSHGTEAVERHLLGRDEMYTHTGASMHAHSLTHHNRLVIFSVKVRYQAG